MKLYLPLRGSPEDSCPRQLLDQLAQQYSADSAYMDIIDVHELTAVEFTSDIVFIMVRDHYHYIDTACNILEQIAINNSNKQFVVICDFGNAISKLDNLCYVNIGGFIVNDQSYRTLEPADKNLNSTQIGVCLNRQMRPHRLSVIALLYGLGLTDQIHISAMHLHKQFAKINSNDLLDHVPWRFKPEHDGIRTSMIKGFTELYEHQAEYKTDQEAYVMQGDVCVYMNNVDNFNKLRPVYANSFVEIVNETVFEVPYTLFSEKTLNSIYAQNFPIFVAPVNYVKYLRDIGFDMFDDIVNHNYDTIEDPVDRMACAIFENQHLFNSNTKQLWLECQSRFANNIAWARDEMYTTFANKVQQDCREFLKC